MPNQPAPAPNLSTAHGTSLDRPPEQQQQQSSSAPAPSPQQPLMQMFEVIVPPGVQPGESFGLLANGQRVLVTCPPNIRPGQKVRFKLPVRDGKEGAGAPPAVQLEYESIKDGWARTIRVTDMRFQWVRMNEDGEIDMKPVERFDVKHSAYTRLITFLEGNDPRMRTGTLSFGTANESSVDSRVVWNGNEVVGYAEIANTVSSIVSTLDARRVRLQRYLHTRLRPYYYLNAILLAALKLLHRCAGKAGLRGEGAVVPGNMPGAPPHEVERRSHAHPRPEAAPPLRFGRGGDEPG